MKKSTKEVKKSLRDEIMTEIALKYRENQKTRQKLQKVNVFLIWTKHDMSYSDFLNVILSLEAQGYLHYERAKDNAEKFCIKGECIPQEFVTLEPSGKSFPETFSDKQESEKRLNIKYPIILAIITALIGILLSNVLIGWLSQLLEWFLSPFHS